MLVGLNANPRTPVRPANSTLGAPPVTATVLTFMSRSLPQYRLVPCSASTTGAPCLSASTWASHTPAVHDVLPQPHAWPHAPQLSGSFVRLVHAGPHVVIGGPQIWPPSSVAA